MIAAYVSILSATFMSWVNIQRSLYALQGGDERDQFPSAVTFAKAYFSFYTTRPLVSS
jgi:hypothetical protein